MKESEIQFKFKDVDPKKTISGKGKPTIVGTGGKTPPPIRTR